MNGPQSNPYLIRVMTTPGFPSCPVRLAKSSVRSGKSGDTTPLTEENVKRLAASRPRDKLIKCAKQHGNDEERDEATEYFKALYHSWELLSSGSHPSGTGLVQVMDQKGSGLRQIGALYGR